MTARPLRFLTAFLPIWFAVAPALALYTTNRDFLAFDYLLKPIGASLVLAGIVFGASLAWLKKLDRSSLLTSGLLLLFFSFGHLLGVMPDQLGGFSFPRVWVTGVLSTVLFALFVYRIVRTRANLQNAVKTLTTVGALLVLFPLAQVGWAEWSSRPAPPPNAPENITSEQALGERPDVYYIILDGYGRQDVYREQYGYDNEPFVTFLRDRGFFVPNRSTSNYPQTFLSLASSLNLMYLDELSERVGDESTNRQPIHDLIEESRVKAFFSGLGYEIVTQTPQIAGLEDVDELTKAFGRKWNLNEFERLFIGTTPLGLVFHDAFQIEQYREDIIGTITRLPQLVDNPRPTFAYIHLMVGHPPFVFNEYGQVDLPPGPINGKDGSHYFAVYPDRDDYRRRHVNQVRYLNTEIERMIEAIMSKSGGSAIIILQADHGPGSGLDWERPDRTDIRERFSIFSAMYVSESADTHWYETITPVNIFRVLLTDIFGADLPRLEDRNHFSTWSKPYRFIDVTEQAAG